MGEKWGAQIHLLLDKHPRAHELCDWLPIVETSIRKCWAMAAEEG